jgi:exodeoxyribonuclease-1
VFIGYNSLGFDETLLRQAFFQNLKPVYLTNTSRNTRADTLRLVQAASIYAAGSIVVPVTEDGRLTRRLEAIAPANGFNGHNAHDALGDVEATIYMARLVKQRAPEIWNTMMPLAAKPEVIQRVLSGQILSLTEFYHGKPYSWLVVGCGQNPEYDAQLGVFDLKYDPDDYLDLPIESLIEVMNSREKAIRCLRANNQPILAPLALTRPELHELCISDDEIQRRAMVIAQAGKFHSRVGEAIANRYPTKEPSIYVEEQIYDGFPTRTDEFFMEKFHRAPWEGRVKLVDQFEDQRLRELGYRLIFTERPGALSAAQQRELERWRNQRLRPLGEVPWLTLAGALDEAEKLEEKATVTDKTISELIDWFCAQSPKVAPQALPNRQLVMV